MIIPVLGMDPSLTNWGLAAANLDLQTGHLETPLVSLVSPKKMKGKQVRNNSNDLYRSVQLAEQAFFAARKAKAVFVEIPVGSQSARAMASYGICVGILAALRAEGVGFIEVTPAAVKEAFTGDKHASKTKMIQQALTLYPEVNFPFRGGKPQNNCEHMADAIGAIHAGVQTSEFQTLMQIYKDIS